MYVPIWRMMFWWLGELRSVSFDLKTNANCFALWKPQFAEFKVDFRWRKVASLGQGRREDLSHACVVYNGSILLMGGQGEGEQVIKTQKKVIKSATGQVMDSGEIYNAANDSWSPTPTRLCRGKRGLSLAVVGGVVFGVDLSSFSLCILFGLLWFFAFIIHNLYADDYQGYRSNLMDYSSTIM